MNATRTTLAIARKELLLLAKDRGALLVLFLLPLLFASLLGSANSAAARSAAQSATGASQAVPTIEIFLVNQDSGSYGSQVTQILKSIDFLKIEELANVDDADRQLAEGKTKKLAAVVIPGDFSRKVDAYEQTGVRVIVDPTRKDFAGIVTGIMNNVVSEVALRGEIQHGIRTTLADSGLYDTADPATQRMIEGQNLGAIMTQLQAMRQQPAIAIRSEDLAGVEEKKEWNPFSYVMPAFTVMFAFFLVSVVAGTLWTEKEQGLFRRLLTAPISRGQIVGGKMLAYGVVVFLQVIFMFGIGHLVFGMPLGSSLLALFLVTLALALVSPALGMLAATVSHSAKQADGLGTLLAFLLAGLGGCILPFFSGIYGPLMATLSKLTPHAHALMGYIAILENNAGVLQVLPQVAILLGFAAVFFGISAWRLRLD